MDTHLRLPVKGTQTESRMLAFRIDGSAVTTSAAATGLLEGANDATVLKGTSGTANEVTLTWDVPFARAPVIVAQAITTNCKIDLKSVSTTGCVLETFQVADGTTGVNDADMHVIVIGWDSAQAY